MDKEALSKSREIGKIVKEDIQQVLDEVGKTSVVKLEPTYRNVLNQPERVAISSASAIAPTELTSVVAESAFNSFVVNLPRPALNVKNLQLLSANIPQAQVNIQDNALVFWYYRLATQNITWRTWFPEEFYNMGDKVSFDGKNYECIQANTGVEPSLDTSSYWQSTALQKFESPNLFNLYCVRLLPSFYKKEMLVDPQLYGYNQTFNSYAELAAELKKACENEDIALAFADGEFVSNTLVFTDPEQYYLPNIADDISIIYDDASNKFVLIGNNVTTPFEIPQWDAETLYPPQSLVKYTIGETEKIYYNWSAEKGFPPANPEPSTSWTEYSYGASTTWNTYLSAGYNDPNVIKLQGEQTNLDWNPYHRFLPNSQGIVYNDLEWKTTKLVQGLAPADKIWDANITYNIGDVVYDNNSQATYQSLQNNNQGIDPATQVDWWELIYNPWIEDTGDHYSGLSPISRLYDMPYLGNIGQPYTNITSDSVVNNQTLNRVLGFTWNGLNMLVPFESVEPFSSGNLVTLFYNRLRPIPQYWTSIILGLGAPYDPEDPSAYTADAFCNLVYSSVVNIYTRILGGSTTDTVRNTNLLAIVPMNCGNLGVTFTNNFIDNPLTKIDTDIYTVEFSFRTETDQPYWFSNNAIITLQLKLGYE